MAKAREVKRRIVSLGKTKQITKTMELVATSKMKKTQERVVAARPFTIKLSEILGSLDVKALGGKFPLLAPRETVTKVAVVTITSNRGFAGALNANVVRRTRALVNELKEAGKQVDLHVFGKKGASALRFMGYQMASSSFELTDKPDFRIAEKLGGEMIAAYETGAIDELQLVYPSYKSLASHPPAVDLILPLASMIEKMIAESRGQSAEFILEPSPETILDALLPMFVKNGIYRAMLELAASEQAARRIAMKNATDAAEELITILTRKYNRARQAQITQELAEIVGGANALE